MNSSAEQTYTVKGMTCNACRAAVLKQVGQVDGVSEVDVDLESGRVAVHGTAVDPQAVRTAIDEAGFELST